MKRTLWFSLVAAAAALLPLSAVAQAVPESAPAAAPSYRYSIYGGLAYTSLNQVNLSRYGLLGGRLALTRDWGKYFELTASGDYEKAPTGSAAPGNPGDPSVYSALIAPGIHVNIWGNFDGLFFGELGLEHTGGEGMIPSSTFAGGFGGGMEYHLNPRWSIEATGDRLAGSFSLNNSTPKLAYSTHKSWNPRASIGAVFHF